MNAIPEIMRHELVTASRSRRLWVVCVVFIGGATAAGAAYAVALNNIRSALIDTMVKKGSSPLAASAALDLASSQGYKTLVAGLAGLQGSELNPDLERSVIMPALLVGAQVLLPWLIGFACFDHVAADLQARTPAFNVLRVSRSEYLAGKTLAWTLVTGILMLAASLCVFGAAQSVMGTPFALADYLLTLKLATVLLPFLGAYVALTTFASTWFARPFAALAATMGLRFVLWLPGIYARRHEADWRYHLRWLSPSTYDSGYWQASWSGPLQSTLAFVCMAAAFYLLADRKLRSRDL